MRSFTLATPHGSIACIDSKGTGPALLFIHGNSACKEVFSRQFDSALAHRCRLVAFDLPGHGASSDAPEPRMSYCFAGYADVAERLTAHLALERVVVVGWSLGGHIAIELVRRGAALAGIVLTGTPPVGPADVEHGFLPHPHMALTGQAKFSEADVAAYAAETAGTAEPFLEAAVRRTDGRAREMMVRAAMAADAANQRTIVESTDLPIAVITGANEPFVNNDYLDTVAWRNLWRGRVHRVADTGHAPFREAPTVFNALLEAFVSDVTQRNVT